MSGSFTPVSGCFYCLKKWESPKPRLRMKVGNQQEDTNIFFQKSGSEFLKNESRIKEGVLFF